MTIEEAAQLVIQSTNMGVGGEVYVLDMGKPVNILKIAKKMISLYGYKFKDSDVVDEYFNNIEIIFTGLRPGEKLHEELLIGNNLRGTSHPKIIKANEEFYSYNKINKIVSELETLIEKQEITDVKEFIKINLKDYDPVEKTDEVEIKQIKKIPKFKIV